MVKTRSMLGLITALKAEAKAVAGRRGWRPLGGWRMLTQPLDGGTDLTCVCCGMGAENAYDAASWLIRQGAAALAVAGISGGVNPDLGCGDVVIPDTILESRHGGPIRQWHPDPRLVKRFREQILPEGLPVHGGSILTVAHPVLTQDAKASLYARTGVQAVDMESAAVARAAADRNLPMVALRTICDAASDDVAGDYLEMVHPDGSLRWPRLAGYLLRRPRRAGDLIRHGRRFHRALYALARGRRCCGGRRPGGIITAP